MSDPTARQVAELKIAVSTQKRKNRALLDLVQSFAQQNTGIGVSTMFDMWCHVTCNSNGKHGGDGESCDSHLNHI